MIKTWQDIPGFFDFMDVYNQAVDESQDGDVLVEVGTFLGKSAAYMADRIKASRKALKLFTVDSWDHPLYARWWETVTASPQAARPGPWPVQELIGIPLPDAFRHSIKAVGADRIITPITSSSVEGAKNFRDHSLFFVFLDADHEYEGIRDDIAAWRNKVKPGGILSGHDYRVSAWPGVAKAVDEQFSNVEHRHNSWLVRM